MKATLTNYRQSPRKVRLVANLIKGKKVADVDTELSYLVKRASDPILKLVRSAIANAEVQGFDKKNLIVDRIEVQKGLVLKRSMPRAFGRASGINKRSSHVHVVLRVVEDTTKQKKTSKKVIKKAPKATKE